MKLELKFMIETLPNPEAGNPLVGRFTALIGCTLEKFSDSVKTSSRFNLDAVELISDGINSALVTRDISGSPKAVIVMRPTGVPYIQIEDYYGVHAGEVMVEHVRHNYSGIATFGFGTELSVGTEVVTDAQLAELETMLDEATIHPNPQSKVFK